jgi:hypothetical protein
MIFIMIKHHIIWAIVQESLDMSVNEAVRDAIWVKPYERAGVHVRGYWKNPNGGKIHEDESPNVDQREHILGRSSAIDHYARRPMIRDYTFEGVKFRVDGATSSGRAIIGAFTSVAEHLHHVDGVFPWMNDEELDEKIRNENSALTNPHNDADSIRRKIDALEEEYSDRTHEKVRDHMDEVITELSRHKVKYQSLRSVLKTMLESYKL